MSAVLVSIVIPCLNEAQQLSALLNSLAAQDYAGCELIVVDGGSSDGTLDLAQRWQRLPPRRPAG